MEKSTEMHPSYVTVSLSRHHGNGTPLFGEVEPVHNFWQLNIHKAKSLGEDLGSGITTDQLLLRMNLSASQIAELFLNQNCGHGTVGTLEFCGAPVPRPPAQESPAKIHIDRFGDVAAAAGGALVEAINALHDLAAPGAKITKGAVERAMSKVEKAKSSIDDHMPYLLKEFERATRQIQTAVDLRESADFSVVKPTFEELVKECREEENEGAG